jgi:hypothetical protein
VNLKPMPCPSCGKAKNAKHYLCGRCWYSLPEATRKRLWRKDDLASARLHELYEQINREVPLGEIEVSA